MVRMYFWWGPLGLWQYFQACVIFPSVMNPFDATEGKKGSGFLKQGLPLKASNKDELFVLSCVMYNNYSALGLSALIFSCKKSNTTSLLTVFFSVLFKTLFVSSWGSPVWDWYQPDSNTMHSRSCEVFSPPQNSAMPIFINKIEAKIFCLCLMCICYKYSSISDYTVIIFILFFLLFLHLVLLSLFGCSW